MIDEGQVGHGIEYWRKISTSLSAHAMLCE